MLARGEALARLQAERGLVKRYKKEYERLVGRRGHVDALRSLVKAHKNAYNELVRQVREELQESSAAAETKTTTRAA
jgi:hypothetical protein